MSYSLSLRELAELEEKATKGEWAVTDHNEQGDCYVGPEDEYVAIVMSHPIPLPTAANAEFIAVARNSMRPLLTLVAQQHEALGLVQNWLPTAPRTRLGSLLTREDVLAHVGTALAAYKEAQGEG